MVEMPPKLMIKLAKMMPRLSGVAFAMSRQPLVISISPPQKADTELGRNERSGENEEITTKKIAIIVPTVITLSEVSIRAEERLKACSSFFIKGLSNSLSFILRYKSPFRNAPKT